MNARESMHDKGFSLSRVSFQDIKPRRLGFSPKLRLLTPIRGFKVASRDFLDVFEDHGNDSGKVKN